MVILQAINRFTWWQRMDCCFSLRNERLLQAQTFLNFEESPDQFPDEFTIFFRGSSIKTEMKQRALKKKN